MRTVSFLPLIALVFAAGCDSTLDQKKLEGAISDKLKEKYPVTSVSCPAARSVKKGDTFSCTAKFEGDVSSDIEVKQDGAGGVTWGAKNILLVSDLTANIVQKEKGDSKDVEASCPGKVIVAKKGSTLACTGKYAGRPIEFAVTFTNDEGSYAIDVKKSDAAVAVAPAEPAPAAQPEGEAPAE